MNQPIRLLYAEDNPLDADLTRTHFEREAPDFRIEIAATGTRCLERLAAEPFDLLLLDNRLPDMEGLDVLGRLRAEGRMLPVAMVTGVGDEETVAKALRAGAADYVPKAEGYLATLPGLLRGLLARQRSHRLLDGADAQRIWNILYVEHNAMDAELTANHFAAAAPHLRLYTATSCLEALALLAPGHSFNLVLTDLRMPDMTALELIREAQHRGIELPFVVITGKGDEATAVAILRLGAYDYLVKRDNYLTQLPHAIDHALQRFHLDQAARRMHAELEALNASLEQKVAERTAELLQEMEVRRASEEKFRRITESAQDAIIMMGPDGNILFWNPAAEQIFGYTAAEATGQDLHALIAPEQAQAESAQGFAQFQKSGTGPIIGRVRELTARRKNGEEFPAEISISAMRLNDRWHAIGILRDISERKRAETEIKERGRQLSTLIGNLPGLVYRCRNDTDYTVEYISDGVAKLTGYPADDFRQHRRHISQYIHPEDQQRVWDEIQAALSNDQPYELDYRIFTASGAEKWVWERGQGIRDAHGQLLALEGFVSDITERVRAEEALQEALDRLAKIIVTVPGIVCSFRLRPDGSACFPYGGERIAEHYGVAPEVLAEDAAPFFALVHPDDLADLKETIAESARHLSPWRHEWRVRHPVRGELWIEGNSMPLREPDGSTLWHGVATDITDRKQAEMLLYESETRFRATFEQAAVGIAHVAPDGHWLRVNQKLCDIVGYSREELLGRTFQDITHPDDLELDLGYVRQMLAGEIPAYSMEKRYLRKDGEVVWINLTVALVRNAGGDPEYFISVVEDITERKRLQRESYLILAMGKAIAEAESFISALDISIRTICESTGWDFGEVWIPSRDGTRLGLGAPCYCRTGNMKDFRDKSGEFEFARGIGLPGRVWASGKPAWIPDVTVDANFPRASLARQTGIRAAVGIPILAENTVVAVMVFFMCRVRSEDERMTALISAVAAQLGTAFQRKRDEEHIQRLANFDALTGLPNRALLTDRINHSISMSQRSRAQLAVMFLDLDRFKNVNDSLGHRIGDELLIAVAKRLKSAVRDEDTISRLGGDEFILLLLDTDANGAARVAEKLLESVAQPYQIEQYELVITPSIGIAMYPTDSTDFESLSRCADVAMYRAKQEGRNGYCFFTQEMQTRSARTLQLENALRHALKHNQLQLHYQPQMSLHDGRAVGAEALLRWQHPELGAISPAEFIPVAEASGQILQIGEWVLRSAIRQLRAWMDGGLAPMTMAVNLSAVQFRHPRLPELVSQILEEARLPPQHLELELTESVTMDDPLAATAVMNSLHERGIRMAIDDFGTGYSSLSYLKRFQVHRLKIDQSFVRDITEDPDDRAIVGAIISMAGALGLQTIAEGVETEGQLAFLREKGCSEMQGYYYSKPLPAEQFEAFVRGKGTES